MSHNIILALQGMLVLDVDDIENLVGHQGDGSRIRMSVVEFLADALGIFLDHASLLKHGLFKLLLGGHNLIRLFLDSFLHSKNLLLFFFHLVEGH